MRRLLLPVAAIIYQVLFRFLCRPIFCSGLFFAIFTPVKLEVFASSTNRVVKMRSQRKPYQYIATISVDEMAEQKEKAPYILVVEDNPDIRSAVSLLLEAMGCQVIKAENGLQALERLRRCDRLPDLILLDLLMPVMNGWQFLQEKSRFEELDAIRTVVLSAVADCDFSLKKQNVSEWAVKPLDFQQLESIVLRNCGKEPTQH